MTKHLLFLLSVAPFVQAAPALLQPFESYSFGKLEEGAFLYADRNYQMYKPPEAIRGMDFLCAEIDGHPTPATLPASGRKTSRQAKASR